MSHEATRDAAGTNVPPATMTQLEAELAQRRTHLSTTIDELVTRLSPREILRREVEAARVKVAELTRTPDGELRTERVAGALAATAVVLVGLGLLRRRQG